MTSVARRVGGSYSILCRRIQLGKHPWYKRGGLQKDKFEVQRTGGATAFVDRGTGSVL
jgi:hypothetical protein